jgi:hypothetical protein
VGRGSKTVLTTAGLDRRAAGYYSTPDFVANFLSDKLLSLSPSAGNVFDPCVGNQELLRPFIDRRLQTAGFDIQEYLADYQCQFEKRDFLKYYCLWKQDSKRAALPFDLWVANPPYNCHEADYVRKHKHLLQAAFDDVGVANTFAMFISAIIDLSRDGAVIGLITYDSFLTTRMHARLRRKILSMCGVHLIALCPSDLFRGQGADVRTCLLVLEKGAHRQQSLVRAGNRPLNKMEFRERLDRDDFEWLPLADLLLGGGRDSDEFVIGCPQDVKALFSAPRLGEVFECATGISTGNDRRYLSPCAKPPYTVPFYKNPGSRRFRCPETSYMDANFLEIAATVPNFIVRNQHLLFREGISCSSMGVSFGAAYMPAGGLFGVNANIFPAKRDLLWLLAYMNSSLVTYFVRGVLLRTNMITSGYVSRIPLIELSGENRRVLQAVAANALNDADGTGQERHIRQIDEVVFAASGITRASQTHILNFSADLVRAT